MATARDKLISDWRERLAAAEAVDTAAESRPAWLARLQIRLYRFLLSLYGAGEWTTTPPARGHQSAPAGEDAVVFDSASAWPLAGKPPKSIGQIRSALESVSRAQPVAPATGPLTQGLSAECWVTAALASGRHRGRILQLAAALHKQQIEYRVRHRAGRDVLEVRESDREQALRIAREFTYRPALPSPPAAEAPAPRLLAKCFLYVIVVACIGGLLTGQIAAYLTLQIQPGVLHPEMRPITWCAFYLGWLFGTTTILFGAASLDLLWAAGSEQLRRFESRNLARGIEGLAWHCLAAGILVGPFIGLFAVAVAGEAVSRAYQPALFFSGWSASALIAALMYLLRHAGRPDGLQCQCQRSDKGGCGQA